MEEKGTSFNDMLVAIAGIGLATTVTTVAIWQGLGLLRARIVGQREADYRRIAEESILAQKRLGDDVADLRQRMMAVEKILRDVE